MCCLCSMGNLILWLVKQGLGTKILSLSFLVLCRAWRAQNRGTQSPAGLFLQLYFSTPGPGEQVPWASLGLPNIPPPSGLLLATGC